ncbi:glycosyltransferase family 4 protein [Anabaena cylindrica FACHB-243]|uniref:Glycosyl transferase group 1 n=1 Tax=Anabaena cylindrica (strain ATCC 27899 / PCC 7122) TaxID=272123 RepID=K9ZL41_ANACC|nr:MULTISPECIES: glycosyltransferase family 4 protein [Anabaena]AFZ59911.1 glycosyl transferase group 1 [Anabaena cylindrica PCC 7122]MBD2416740.1 glycosyltransferase family 4 protein [Anabaena cylindrica FACHB-243]MBY5285040.1 glycosyltransferase family 4 protein [Anabaena sp. CCAP 1446/1C]MBY5308052.1 glycosyltransferase family 4 protein [Anabaena sp. CCAP 1446/1C]MCM2409839.1 glycosyltransferase family 4 protein [Anabaena sp. CCAP 1446/1C]
MKIAQIAPLWERVPPPAYGGIELVVGLLTDELVRKGHEVTLFASGDSLTLAKLISVHPRALRLDKTVKDCSIYESLQLASVYERADEFDIIHSHMGHSPLAYANLVKTPTIHTLHGIFTPDNEKIFRYAKKQPYVSISDAQREPSLELNYVATVYNGIDVSSYEFYAQPTDPPYLAFLGRISPEKGPHLAIEIAKKSGWQLKIAGKVDFVDVEYFETQIKPQIDGKQIQYLGEANHVQKNAIMGGAVATLFPITWREPFGLVMVESMAAGTPVIAMRMGSTPEVISDGETGFLCDNTQECINAIDKINRLNRYACRHYAEEKFSLQQMTNGYEALYQQIIGEKIAQQNGYLRPALV